MRALWFVVVALFVMDSLAFSPVAEAPDGRHSPHRRRQARPVGFDPAQRIRETRALGALAPRTGHRRRHHARPQGGRDPVSTLGRRRCSRNRVANDSRDDPTAKCVVGGVPRSNFVGYPFQDPLGAGLWWSSCMRPSTRTGRSSRTGDRCRPTESIIDRLLGGALGR